MDFGESVAAKKIVNKHREQVEPNGEKSSKLGKFQVRNKRKETKGRIASDRT